MLPFPAEYIIHTLTTIALTNPTSSRETGTCASGSLGSKYGDLLYVEMRTWVARLITCARQLFVVSDWIQLAKKLTYLIFLVFQLYSLPVAVFRRAASSFIIVRLLLALSQVTWPIFTVNDEQSMTTGVSNTPYARFPLFWQSWRVPDQAVDHYGHCWGAWTQ